MAGSGGVTAIICILTKTTKSSLSNKSRYLLLYANLLYTNSTT